jgi:ferrous iron transport protein B
MNNPGSLRGTAPPNNANDTQNVSQTVVALIGNPNTGKSTVFNGLTGLKQKTANYPGVTVERHTGIIEVGGRNTTLVDLPGTYSLTAQSPDEMIAIDVLLGLVESLARPKAILAVADATNLRRNLFLVTQLAELDIPVVLAVNMIDLAHKKGIEIDCERLADALGIHVVPIVANDRTGFDQMERALAEAIDERPSARAVLMPDVHAAADRIWHKLDDAGRHLTPYEVERALIDAHGFAERRFELIAGEQLFIELEELRMKLSTGSSLAAIEAKLRYGLIDKALENVETRHERNITFGERLDSVTNRPVISVILFVMVMATVFQAVFSWATPLMDLIDGIATSLSNTLMAILPEGALASLLTDGIIAGVGSVLIFLPQILILFAFIIFLEDSGYMPRVAFMSDRIMRSVGLSGQSFIPMLSSYACAVPGIMATRVIPERRDRIATMLAAPMMTCSARLPVYALLISAFVPERYFLGGLINLQGLVLLGLYLLGIIGGIMTALLLKKTALSGPTPTFLIELPPYRLPNFRSVLIKLLARGKIFLTRAGTVIFTVAVLIWALAYFPRPQTILDDYDTRRGAAESTLQEPDLSRRLYELDQLEATVLLEQSLLGRTAKFVAPVFKPLGWDWKISAAVIAGFPAREVVIAVLGTIYAVGDIDSNENALVTRLRDAKHEDGSRVFTLSVVIGLLIFYAFALQCVATIAVMYRETNTWRWPLFAWVYMTGLGYAGAWLVQQFGI